MKVIPRTLSYTARLLVSVAPIGSPRIAPQDRRAMKKLLGLLVVVLASHPARAADAAAQAPRPPAVPLVACDPYFCIWSPADTLAGAATVHWTGKAQPL